MKCIHQFLCLLTISAVTSEPTVSGTDLDNGCANYDGEHNESCNVLQSEQQKLANHDVTVWEIGDLWELSAALECPDDDPSAYSHIHDDEAWKIFNEAYHKAITVTTSTIPAAFDKSGFHVPIEIKFHPDVGRGIFATTHLKKGTLVWTALNSAQFVTGKEFRLFLKHLPKKFACDVLIWSYTVRTPSSLAATNNNSAEEYSICVDLDAGALFNTALYDSERNVEDITSDHETPKSGCAGNGIHTTRDVSPGEELRMDYGDFVAIEGWAALGLSKPYDDEDDANDDDHLDDDDDDDDDDA